MTFFPLQYSIIELLSDILILACTIMTTYLLIKEKKKEDKINLTVLDLVLPKSKKDSPEYIKNHYRIIHGTPRHVNYTETKKIIHEEQINDDKLKQDILENKLSVSFILIDEEKKIVFNLLTEYETEFLIENNITEVRFKNNGVTIKKVSINYAVIINAADSEFFLNGRNNFAYDIQIEKGKDFVFYQSEVSQDYARSFCALSREIYEKLPDKFSLINNNLQLKNILSYKKIIISFAFIDIDDKISYQDLTLSPNFEHNQYLRKFEKSNAVKLFLNLRKYNKKYNNGKYIQAYKKHRKHLHEIR